MKRLAQMISIVPLLLLGCTAHPAQAKESPTMKDADQLFASGKYDAALQRYRQVADHPPDDRQYTRATFRVIECHQLLGQPEQALDRARSAKAPGDARLRGIV